MVSYIHKRTNAPPAQAYALCLSPRSIRQKVENRVMYRITCKIKNKIAENRCICFDFSDQIQIFDEFLKLLSASKISGILLFDSSSKEKIVLKTGIQNELETNTLLINKETFEVLQKLVLDVISGNSFPGYHLDIELFNGVDVTFILCSRSMDTK